jgi:hypothetical protein
MMSIPFQMGFAPERWRRVTDIMLEKEENNPRCHCLRILALFESDLNHAKWIIIGRKPLLHMQDNGMLPTMQHGSVPGKHCLNAVLKKVLSHDHLRLTKRAGAFIENDAVWCYNRLVNNLVLMVMSKLGLPKSITSCIGELWDHVIHMNKTVYGILSATYGSTAAKPFSAAKFVSACKEIIVEITGVSFVDDSSLSVTSDHEVDHNLSLEENKIIEMRHLVQRLSALSQHWEKLLFTTGGAINFQKSHWYVMSWLWKNGVPRLATSRQMPATLSLTTGYGSLLEIVPRIEPT